MKTIGYAATASDSPLAPFDFERKSLRGTTDERIRALPATPDKFL